MIKHKLNGLGGTSSHVRNAQDLREIFVRRTSLLSQGNYNFTFGVVVFSMVHRLHDFEQRETAINKAFRDNIL